MLDQTTLNAYLAKASNLYRSIESSLDKGVVALPEKVIRQPELQQQDLPDPRKISKTPYTEAIDGVANLFTEVRESDLSKRAVRDLGNGTAKSMVLPRHLQEMKTISAELNARE